MTVQRMAFVIGIKADKIDLYRELHANPWPENNAALQSADISNYSIFLREPENLLFGYWEYSGTDIAADLNALDGTELSKRWLALTDPCQTPLPSAKFGERWCTMVEIYHLD